MNPYSCFGLPSFGTNSETLKPCFVLYQLFYPSKNMIILMKKPLKLKNRNRRISTFKPKFLVQFSRHTLGFSSYALPKGLILGIIGSKALSSASLISRYFLRLGQYGRCCFCAACPNRKMYLEIRRADEWFLSFEY